MVTTINVRLGFSVAKRLMKMQGACNRLHGYYHIMEASFSAEKMENGLVADYYEITGKLQNWLQTNWDHNLILSEDDKELGDNVRKITGQAVFYLHADPTAENMAAFIKEKISKELFPELNCVRVKIYDNDFAFAEVS